MVGAGDTGKTQLKSLTERLFGECNTSPADLSDLEKRFGTSRIYGKRLVGSNDMSYATVSELKLFKQITGGDEISVEKKARTLLTINTMVFYGSVQMNCQNLEETVENGCMKELSHSNVVM